MRHTHLAHLRVKESRPINPASYAETIDQRSLQLPEQAAQEARDASAFLAAVAGTWGPDFPDDIDDADLTADAPRDEL